MRHLGVLTSIFLVASLVASPAAAEFCSGCGCKGGPGYRGPDGKCVGWKTLNKVCGKPPTKNCAKEGGGK